MDQMTPGTVSNQLVHEDLTWIAERIHQYRHELLRHPSWKHRLNDAVDVLIWSASVDQRLGDVVQKDGLVPAGQRLREAHFRNVPHTADAWTALREGRLKSIVREHIVPRSKLRAILFQTSATADSIRVLNEYARVALVEATEAKRLKPSKDMPKGWDAHIDWSRSPLPQKLPSAWARYEQAKPPVVVGHYAI